jgi:hypothetical protein
MSLFGLPHKELMELAKRFKDGRDFLGLSKEQVAKMLGVSMGEINFLETFALVNLKDKLSDVKADAKRHMELSKALDENEDRCPNCNGEMWVCEHHRNVAWQGGNATCCKEAGEKFDCGAGAPCKCNMMGHHNFKEVFSEVEEDKGVVQ